MNNDNTPQLHNTIAAMTSLTAGIASRHPGMGLCQLDKAVAECV